MSEYHEKKGCVITKKPFKSSTCPHFCLQFLDAIDDTEPPSDFVTEERLAELEHGPHSEGEIDQVDVLVAHGQVLLADGEHPGALAGGPDAQVGQGQARAVEHVGEPADLVLLVM